MYIFYDPAKAKVSSWWLEGPELVIEHYHRDYLSTINYVRVPNYLLWNQLLNRLDVEEAVSDNDLLVYVGGRETIFSMEEFVQEGLVDMGDVEKVFQMAVEFHLMTPEEIIESDALDVILNIRYWTRQMTSALDECMEKLKPVFQIS